MPTPQRGFAFTSYSLPAFPGALRIGSKAVLGEFLGDVRFTPTNRPRRARASGPKSADFVAKVPKCRATNFSRKDETGRNAQSIYPPGHYRSRRLVRR